MIRQEAATFANTDSDQADPPADTLEFGTPADDVDVEVAHEALIRHWDRLQAWLSEDRVGLQLRQEITDAASRWHDRGQHGDYLVHHGSRLREVEALQDANRLRLNALEARYLAACVAVRDREEAEKQARLIEDQRAEDQRRAANRFRLLSVGLAILVLVAGAMSWLAYQQRQEARAQRGLAEQQADFAQQQAVISQVSDISGTSINLATADQQDQLAALLGVAAARIADDANVESTAGDVGTALQASIGAPYFSWLLDSGTESEVSSLAFDPGRNQLAAGHRNGAVVLWDLSTNPTFRPLDPGSTGGDVWISSVSFSPDGRYLAAASYAGAIRIWDMQAQGQENVIATLELPRAIYSLTFGASPSHGVFLLAAACAEQTCASNSLGDAASIDEAGNIGSVIVKRWLASSGFSESDAESFALPGNRIYATAVSENGRWLAAGGCKRFDQPPTTEPSSDNACPAGFLYLRDLEDTTAPLIAIDPGAGAVMALAFAPGTAERPLLASGGDDRIVRIWQPGYDGSDSVLTVSLTGQNEEIRSLAFHPTESLLVSGGHDGGISLWDFGSQHPVIQELGDSSSWVRAVTFNASGNRMVSTQGNGQIRIWEIAPEHPLSEPGILTGHAAYIRALAFSPNPDTPMLASAAEDGVVRIWSVENGQVTVRSVEVRAPSEQVKLSGLSFNHDGSMLAVADERGALWVFDPRQFSPVPVRIGSYRGGTLVPAFSPVTSIVAVGGSHGVVRLFDAAADEPTLVREDLQAGDAQIWTVAFNRDGSLLAAGTTTGAVYRWRLSSDGQAAEALPMLSLENVAIRALAFGPDDALVTGDSAGSLCFWGNGEPASPTDCPKRMYGHNGDIRSVAFSPNGDLLASGGIDQTVRLWDPHDLNAAPVVIPTIMEWVRALAFSPDGRVLAAPSTQGTIRIILPNTQDLRDRACARVGRDMTPEEWSAYMQDAPYQPTCPDSETDGEQGMTQPAPLSATIAASLILPPLMSLQGRRRRRPPSPHRRSAPPTANRRSTIREGSG